MQSVLTIIYHAESPNWCFLELVQNLYFPKWNRRLLSENKQTKIVARGIASLLQQWYYRKTTKLETELSKCIVRIFEITSVSCVQISHYTAFLKIAIWTLYSYRYLVYYILFDILYTLYLFDLDLNKKIYGQHFSFSQLRLPSFSTIKTRLVLSTGKSAFLSDSRVASSITTWCWCWSR